MKTYRLDFMKGINVIGDKAILPVGFVSMIDNVDMRSGSLKPIKAPEAQFQVADTDTRSWSYRGRWFHSTDWRDYVGEYVGGTERVYFSESGKFPKKSIDGTTAFLGTARPVTAPVAAKATTISPISTTATVLYSGNGNLADGDRYYRISAMTADGILPPCGAVYAKVEDTGHKGASVRLTWGAVPKATAYIIFEGTQERHVRLREIAPSQLTFEDTGQYIPSGEVASQYDQTQDMTYAYTYKRKVGLVVDESGMSFPSTAITGASGRLVSRDMANDGYWDALDADTDAPAVQTLVSGSIGVSVDTPAYGVVPLTGVTPTYNMILLQTDFHVVGHGLSTGDKLKFVMADAGWNSNTLEIVVIGADDFCVKSMKVPTDTMPLTASASYQLVKSVVTYVASGTKYVATGDVVNLVGSSATTSINGYYKATRISNIKFTIDFICTEAITLTAASCKWIPGNAFYDKWCLYRNEQGGWFLVDEIDMWEKSYLDAKPFAALGGAPSSFYAENGQTVDYDHPPQGITNIVSHYGMLFGIDGHNVRWTPILQPDAWPEVFSVSLPYQPVAIASYSQGLIILCQDSIYRLDGNAATTLSLSKTMAEDGCFAPHTVQKTDRGLIYLGKRGIMVFNGTQAECITDNRVSGTSLTAPSKMKNPYPFWWYPTVITRNYADFASQDSIPNSQYNFTINRTKTIDGYNTNIKSFYHQGKYYLFYTGADYEANTAICVDFQLQGFPITTLGMKILDAHVNDTEDAFILVDNDGLTRTLSFFNYQDNPLSLAAGGWVEQQGVTSIIPGSLTVRANSSWGYAQASPTIVKCYTDVAGEWSIVNTDITLRHARALDDAYTSSGTLALVSTGVKANPRLPSETFTITPALDNMSAIITSLQFQIGGGAGSWVSGAQGYCNITVKCGTSTQIIQVYDWGY